MWMWLRDHVLPGLITAAIIGASHAHLLRRIKRLTAAQTRELKSGTDEGSEHG
jgi:hypothetical protein